MKTIYSHKNTQKILVSVIIPVFNELGNIKVLNRFLKIAFASKGMRYEVIYIDDHSTDGTYEYLSGIADKKSVFVYKKLGKKGKSYSLTEGFSYARGDYLAMIDADLQYPVTALPEMARLLTNSDVIVANRKKLKTTLLRRITSKGFRIIFGRILFGLHTDIQSGLKIFTRRVYDAVKFTPKTPWTFDLEFLFRAREAGFKIKNYDIIFAQRHNGTSNILFFRQIFEIGFNALEVRLKRIPPLLVPPENSHSMLGAGIGHRQKLYITHTTLPYHKTAYKTFYRKQLFVIMLLLTVLITGLIIHPLKALQTVISVISLVYFTDVVFNAVIIWRSLTKRRELQFSRRELIKLNSLNLPVYSILCPLYKESSVLPQFIQAIEKLDWPKAKLDVILLLEEDDTETITFVKSMKLPSYIRAEIVPYSEPKTKPKACNYGLNIAKGEYIVIFDAEDIPEPDQLKKAYCGFRKSDPKTICLQAKLNYYNPKQNLLTRFFTSEYSLWFDLVLPGLQSLNTSLPLGGTSNHFKTVLLRKLHGWDTFNVTEDADLGIRLFKEGYKTAIIDSLTLEEANSNFHNWLRQRSRWIKGYIQSYLVHTRDIVTYARKNSFHALLMQLIIGSKLTFILLNPLLWVMTISYFLLYRYVGPAIESVYLTPAFYLAVISLVFGNFLFFYYYMIGNARRNQWDLMWSSLFIPIYWVFISAAGWIALYQLIVKPHYWEKTIHGFHLLNKPTQIELEITIETPVRRRLNIPRIPGYISAVRYFISEHKRNIAAGSLLVFGTVIAHILNLLFNIFIFRDNRIPFEAISVISLLSGFYYLISIPISALGSASTHKTAILEARFGPLSAYAFRSQLRKKIFYLSLGATFIWIAAIPVLRGFFKVNSIYPFILFTPILLVAFEYALDRGYLSGRLLFGKLAFLIVLEPLIKLVIAFTFVTAGFNDLAYIAIPYSFVIVYLAGVVTLPKVKSFVADKPRFENISFPFKFFSASVASGISSIAFLSLDILLANHYLTPIDAGKYALISLVGKMVYFLGGLSSQFVLPLTSKYKDRKKLSGRVLKLSLLGTTILSLSGLIVFGWFGSVTLPILLGGKATAILPYIFIFSVGIACFTVSRVFSIYYLARNIYSFQVVTLFLTTVQILLISFNHDSLAVFVQMMAVIGAAHLLLMLVLHLNNSVVFTLEQSLKRLYRFISRRDGAYETPFRKPAILIFNWRDSKHVWSGGAEVYIQEIAKRWVKLGVDVTIFCGNDGKSPFDESVDGVKIMRRGGTFTVYVWAMFYYLFVFRRKIDAVVDCENGIPFFSPIYVRKPVFLLIHHVHQDVFRQYLFAPLALIAKVLESKLMPYIYKNNPVITVSESSRREILKLGFSQPENIHIIYNGIDSVYFHPGEKTQCPSFIYLGRLKPHKNIDVCIKAFAKVKKCHPSAVLNIVGDGESESKLRELVSVMKLSDSVRFFGKVSDRLKAQLLAQSWVMIQPSQIEGWGITVIEANSCGTPVIASNVNGLKDSVVDGVTGILVEARNVKQLTYAMDAMVTNKTLLERYKKNAVNWSRNFTWEKSAETLFTLISYSPVKKVFAHAYSNIMAAGKSR